MSVTTRTAEIGQIVGPWRLLHELGSGGMARVFAAEHLKDGQRAAVKLLHREHSHLDRARLIDEGKMIGRIPHAGVTRILEVDVLPSGCAYIVMDLLHGTSLKQHWLDRGRRLELSEALALCDQVLDVLSAAHSVGIVHRDIKPDNVFLLTSGGVKVLDFGIARWPRGGAPLTGAHDVLGTPAFMSPEQALSKWDEIDPRTDVFAVGAMLFTLLTGEFIHNGRTAPELLVKAATSPARSLREVLPDAPAALIAVVARATHFDRAQRPSTAKVLQAELRRLHSALDPTTQRSTQRLTPHPGGPGTRHALRRPRLLIPTTTRSQSLGAATPPLPSSVRQLQVIIPASSNRRRAALVALAILISLGLVVGTVRFSREVNSTDAGGSLRALEADVSAQRRNLLRSGYQILVDHPRPDVLAHGLFVEGFGCQANVTLYPFKDGAAALAFAESLPSTPNTRPIVVRGSLVIVVDLAELREQARCATELRAVVSR